MVSPSHHKSPFSSLHKTSPTPSSTSSSNSSSSSSTSITTMKIKNIIHNLIFSHICRVLRALSKAKSVILEVFRENQLMYLKQSKRKNKYRKKILFGSFRLHYNWCSSSSHVLPIPSPFFEDIIKNPNYPSNPNNSHINYYDSSWNSVYENRGFGVDDDGGVTKEEESELSSYLQWLEEKSSAKHEKVIEGNNINKNNNNSNNNNNNGNNNNNNNNNGNNNNNNGENEIDKLADMFIADCHEKFRLEKIESYRRCQELIARFM